MGKLKINKKIITKLLVNVSVEKGDWFIDHFNVVFNFLTLIKSPPILFMFKY